MNQIVYTYRYGDQLITNICVRRFDIFDKLNSGAVESIYLGDTCNQIQNVHLGRYMNSLNMFIPILMHFFNTYSSKAKHFVLN